MDEPIEQAVDFSKLPLEKRINHSNWKARVSGYEEASNQLINGVIGSEIFTNFHSVAKKAITESNAAALEKGSQMVLNMVLNCDEMKQHVEVVMNGVVNKCFTAAKSTVKANAEEISIAFIEIHEQQEAVTDILLNMFENKSPKISSSSILMYRRLLEEFGGKVIPMKKIVKKIAAVLEARDKNVREEAKLLVFEIYKWIGEAIKPSISSVKNVLLTELESEFEKLSSEKPFPKRLLKSQQIQASGDTVDAESPNDGPSNCASELHQAVDVDDFLDPVDVLKQIPKTFYSNLGSAKWQDRKEALESFLKISKAPKYEPNRDYSDLAKSLKSVLSNDANIVCVGLACQAIENVCKGLKSNFNYANWLLPAMLEKFKEKKPTVVNPLREAVDAAFVCTGANWENFVELVTPFLINKSPTVKCESTLFLARCIRSHSAGITKKAKKSLATTLIKLVEDPLPAARDAASEALAVLLSVPPKDPSIDMLLSRLDKQKMDKINTLRGKEDSSKCGEVPGSVTRPTSKSGAGAPRKSDLKPVGKKVPVGSKPRPSSKPSVNKAPGLKAPTMAPKSNGQVKEKGLFFPNTSSNKAERKLNEQCLLNFNWRMNKFTPPYFEYFKKIFSEFSSDDIVKQVASDDFKDHIKVLATIEKEFPNYKSVLLDHSDIILKWCGVRLSNANANLLPKLVDFLQFFVKACSAEDITMSDMEYQVLVPNTVLKLGDNREEIGKKIIALLDLFCLVYSHPVIFSEIISAMEKSNNSKLRARCLRACSVFLKNQDESTLDAVETRANKSKNIVAIGKVMNDRDQNVRDESRKLMDMIVDLRGNDNIMAMFLPLTESEKSAYMTRYSKPRKTNGVATKTIEPRSSVSNGAAQNGRASGLSRPGTVKLGTKKSIPRPGTFKVSKSIEGRSGGFSRSNSNFKSEPNLVSTESLLVALDAGVKSFNAKEILRATELIREKVRPSEIETYIISNLSTLIHSLISASLLSRQMFLNESDETSLIAVKIISRINASFLEICLKTPVGAIGKDDFEGILNEILETMAEDGIKAIEAGQNILQRLNVHVLKIVDAPPTHVSMVAGIRIMQRNLRSNGSEGVKNLAMRVLWRILNTFDKKSWDSEGNVEVLLQIYMFFEEFPQETWARLEDDKRVPYTSIKNCIVRLAKREGKKLVSSMSLVPQLKGTQLASYVSTVVNSMENEIE